MLIVQQVVDKKGLHVKVSSGWWESFRRRHRDQAVRSAECISYAIILAGIPSILSNYVDLLENMHLWLLLIVRYVYVCITVCIIYNCSNHVCIIIQGHAGILW